MSSSINKNVNVERRTWDKETYEKRAQSRLAAENDEGSSSTPQISDAVNNDIESDAAKSLKNEIDPTEEKEEFEPAKQGRAGPEGSKRAFLKSRSNKVDLESKLGSTEIIDPAAASATKSSDVLTPSSGVSKCSDGVGWHCRVCDCFLKDSLTYLDHINGRKHQRHLGYTMRVEKSTTDEVCGVLSSLAEKKRERESSSSILGGGTAASETVDFEDVVRKKDEEAVRRKAERARKREERKLREKEGNTAIQVKQHTTEEANNSVDEKKDKTHDDPAVEVDEEEEEEEEEPQIDPALAAMMGISSFGSSKK